MDSVSSWAMTVSICAAVVSIVELLISDTALEKTVRFVLGVFMLTAIVLPAGEVIRDLTEEKPLGQLPEMSEIPFEIETQRENYLRLQLSTLIDRTLQEKNIHAAKIEVGIRTDEDDSISDITAEISLHRTDAQKSSEVSRIIKNELGISCRTLIVP